MKTRHLLVSMGLGLVLALALLWVLGGGSVRATAAPLAQPASSTKEGSDVAPSAPAAELRVCAAGSPTCTYTTVQAAVDAANVGDVIKVASGIYTGVHARAGISQVVYISKSVTIRGGYAVDEWGVSAPDANPTTLDAQGQGRVLYVTGDITPSIEGLRITGGNAAGLGGGSAGWDAGGGLYIVNAEAVISNNRVFSNTAFGGGGLYLHQSGATLNANTISGNTTSGAQDGGGGLYLSESPANLSANTISSNDTTNEGGGLYLLNSDATLEGNVISLNSAGDDGGGLYLNDSDVTLQGNTVISNRAYAAGGGLFVREQSDVTLDSNVVADNQATTTGGGVYVRGASLRMRHNTLARNHGDSGIHVTNFDSYYGTVALTNTILVSHTIGIIVTADSTATLEATLWGDGAWANIADWGGTGNIFTGTVNVRGNPAFVGDDDYHITANSAAKDAGVDAGVAPDIDWDLRPIGAGFDIGADEFPIVVTTDPGVSTTLIYVDPRDNLTRLRVPAGAVTGTSTITIVYTPKDPRTAIPLPEDLVVGPHVFDLDVYRDGVLVPHFVFARAVTLTSEYSDADVVGIEEDSLALYRKTEGEWKIIGTRPSETQTLDVENNLLTSYLWGASRFGEMGDPTILRFVFLPLILRNGSSGTVQLP